MLQQHLNDDTADICCCSCAIAGRVITDVLQELGPPAGGDNNKSMSMAHNKSAKWLEAGLRPTQPGKTW